MDFNAFPDEGLLKLSRGNQNGEGLLMKTKSLKMRE